MIYVYTCPTCECDVEVVKKMDESKRTEYCPKCNTEMHRSFNVGLIYPRGAPDKGWVPSGHKPKNTP